MEPITPEEQETATRRLRDTVTTGLSQDWVDAMPRCKSCKFTYREHWQNMKGTSICPVEVNGKTSQYGAKVESK